MKKIEKKNSNNIREAIESKNVIKKIEGKMKNKKNEIFEKKMDKTLTKKSNLKLKVNENIKSDSKKSIKKKGKKIFKKKFNGGFSGKFKGRYKRKTNKKLNRYYLFKKSKIKRIATITNFLNGRLKSNIRWQHKKYFKLKNLKINKIANLFPKVNVANILLKDVRVNKNLFKKEAANVAYILNKEKEDKFYGLRLRNLILRRGAKYIKKQFSKKGKVFQGLRVLKKQLKVKSKICLVTINEKIKKNPKVIVKNENGIKKTTNVTSNRMKLSSNKYYVYQNKIRETTIKNENLETSLNIEELIKKDNNNKTNVISILNHYYKNQLKNIPYSKHIRSTFYNLKLKIKKTRQKAIDEIKKQIKSENKNKKFVIRKGIKKLIGLKLLSVKEPSLLNSLSIINTSKKKNRIKHYLKNLKESIMKTKDWESCLTKELKSKKKKYNNKKFLLSRLSLYSLWDNKLYLKKRYNKLRTNRGIKKLKDIVNLIKIEKQAEYDLKKQKKQFHILTRNKNMKADHMNIINEILKIKSNLIYYMRRKMKRRLPSQNKKKINQVVKNKNKTKKGKKNEKKKNKVNLLNEIQKLVIKTKRKNKKNRIKTKRIIYKIEQVTAKAKAIANIQSKEVSNENIIKIILFLLKKRGEIENNGKNFDNNVLNISQYIKEDLDLIENKEIIKFIKAKLINGLLEQKGFVELKELQQNLIIQKKEVDGIEFPKKRLPPREFKEFLEGYYKEKNKYTAFQKEMKKNVVNYYFFTEKVKANEKVYQIKLPKKRIIVPTLRTMYKGIKRAIKIKRLKLKQKRYGKRSKRNYKNKRYKGRQRRYNPKEKEKRKKIREKRRRKKQLLKLKRKKVEIPRMGILKIKLKKRNMFLILCNRKTNKIDEQVTARELYYKISEARNDVKSEKGKKINRRKTAIKDKGPIGRHISTTHFRLFILSLLFVFRAKYKVLDVEIEKKSRKKIVRIIRKKYWYPFLAQLGVFRRFKFIKNKPHGRMRKRKTKRR